MVEEEKKCVNLQLEKHQVFWDKSWFQFFLILYLFTFSFLKVRPCDRGGPVRVAVKGPYG